MDELVPYLRYRRYRTKYKYHGAVRAVEFVPQHKLVPVVQRQQRQAAALPWPDGAVHGGR